MQRSELSKAETADDGNPKLKRQGTQEMFSAGGSSVESGTEITFQVASIVSWLNIDGLSCLAS